MRTFEEIVGYVPKLEAYYSDRNALWDECEQIFFLEDTDLPSEDWIKKTFSPDGRNKLQGAARLLSVTNPDFSVPYDANDLDAKQSSSLVEKLAKKTYREACSARQKTIHTEAALALLLYDEIHLAVTSMADVVAGSTEGDKKRAQMIAERTPVLIEPLNPKSGYPEFDHLGLKSYYQKREMTVFEVIGRYAKAKDQLAGKSMTDIVKVCEWWDIDQHLVWIEGNNDPLINNKNEYPFIPIIVQIAEGSRMFTETDRSRQPFFYTLIKSNLWKRQNLSLTVLYSILFAVGSSPTFKHTSQDGTPVEVSHSGPTTTIELTSGESYEIVANKAIDPTLLQALNIADEKSEQSTMFSQALGQPIGSNSAYSMVALLNQAGRLPLAEYQRVGGEALAEAMRHALWLMKNGKASIPKGLDMKASDIPNDFVIECKLDISLPQDERQNAMIAKQLTEGDEPLTSKRWVRENILQIGQSDEMEEEIWAEKIATKYAQAKAQIEVEKKLAALQQGTPTEASVTPGIAGGGNAPMQSALVGQPGVSDGLPMTEPINPQEMGGAMLPPPEMQQV
jgi:hypothetical protein